MNLSEERGTVPRQNFLQNLDIAEAQAVRW